VTRVGNLDTGQNVAKSGTRVQIDLEQFKPNWSLFPDSSHDFV